MYSKISKDNMAYSRHFFYLFKSSFYKYLLALIPADTATR